MPSTLLSASTGACKTALGCSKHSSNAASLEEPTPGTSASATYARRSSGVHSVIAGLDLPSSLYHRPQLGLEWVEPGSRRAGDRKYGAGIGGPKQGQLG